jgi:hypothetical protein
MSKCKTVLIVFALIALYAINAFNTVSAEEVVDDTFDTMSFINIQISNQKATPTPVEFLNTVTISFRVSWSWPGLTALNDYKVDLIRNSDNYIINSWTGTARKGDPEYREISHDLHGTDTYFAGTFTYSIKAYRRSAHQWEIMDTKTVNVIVVDNRPSVSIDAFTISPSTVISGDDIKGSITVSSKNLKLSNYFLTVVLRDTTNNKNIKSYVTILSGSKPTSTFPVSLDLGSSVGKIDIKAEIRIVLPLTTITTKTRTASVTISSDGSGGGDDGGVSENKQPNKPSPPVGPSNVIVNRKYTYYFVTTDPDGDNVRYRYAINYKQSDWSTYYSSGAQASFDITFQSTGTYSLEIQAQDIHGKLSLWSSSLNIVVKSEAIGDAPQIVTFFSDPETIYSGGFSSIHWEAKNADSVTISHGVNPTGSVKGSFIVRPTETTKYTLTAEKAGHSPATRDIEITVKPHPPIVSISADKTSVVIGDAVIISWNIQYADRVEITPGISTNNELEGSRVVYPKITTTYVATASGTGVSTDAVTIYVVGTDGQLLTGFKDSPIFWVVIGMFIVFILANILYFQKTKKIPPYRKFFGKIWAWIKNVEYEDKNEDKIKKSSDSFDHVIKIGDSVDSDSIRIYRRKNKINKTKKGR